MKTPTHAEAMSLLLREIIANADRITEADVRKLLSSVGIDYEEAKARDEADPMTEAEILSLLTA